jgi:hypothetical protein
MHEAYLEHMDPDRYEQMVRIASSVARDFEVPYYNDTFLDIFEEENFYDSNHLNVEGANRWTRLIALRIEQFENSSSVAMLPTTVLPEGR